MAIRDRTFISGLGDGETLVGIDFRPATGVLYAVGRIGGSSVGQLYTIDLKSAHATAVGARTIPLAGKAFGVDFNPVPDLLRIVSDAGQNIRVRPVDGTVAGTDTNLAYPAMGDPNATRLARVVAVAYTNPDADAQTNTVLHDIDVNRAADADRDSDVLAIQVPPNGGVLNTVGSLGIDADDLVAFDIGPDNEALAAILRVGSASSHLYFIDLPSGNAVDLGRIGKGELIVGLAIQLGPQCVAGSVAGCSGEGGSRHSRHAIAQTTATSECRFPLPGHGHLVIQVPRDWKDQLRQPPINCRHHHPRPEPEGPFMSS